MYRGYNISKESLYQLFDQIGYSDLVDMDSFYESQKHSVHNNLNRVFQEMENSVIDGDKIQTMWFPDVNTHVFISHSHNDIYLAKILAGWLYGRFRIKSFIDSCIWGYANDLLKIIDKKYCKNTDSNTYNYNKRNYSTSHVHMMLMTALNKMIDKSECIIFLNTTQSNIGDGITNMTLSPWIYGEIETTRIIQKNLPIRLRTYSDGRSELDENRLNIGHQLIFDHFYELSLPTLLRWNDVSPSSPENALDDLYKLTPRTP